MRAPNPCHLVVAALLAFALASGCGASTSHTRSGSDSDPAAAGAVVGQALDLSGRRLDSGETLSLASLRGAVVVVDFWASWCVPCRDAMPFYEALYQAHRDAGLRVVSVSVDEDEALARRFLEAAPVSFDVLWDDGHELAARLALEAMPTSFILDRRGVVRAIHTGFFDRTGDDTRVLVEALLAEAP